MQALSKTLQADWFGPLAVTVFAVAVIGSLSPTFLSPLNIEVLLLAVAVNVLIAFSQMIIIALGQMNLAVGAIGGLAAISFAGLMQVWAVPVPLAVVAALDDRHHRRSRQRRLHRRDRHLGLRHHPGEPVGVQGRQLRHHAGPAVLRHPRERQGLRHRHRRGPTAMARRPDDRRRPR